MPIDAVLGSDRGLVVAPAGCGKTHLITKSLGISPSKPYLVLTHTTAGVAALKQRLKRLGVANKNYVVTTIDGWARFISNSFPSSCNVLADQNNLNAYYPELRRTVHRYLAAGHISEIIQSSYSRVLVDEYQDCNIDQHEIIVTLSEILPTVVFGDPLQAIFNFGGPMPSWNDDVHSSFPLICELSEPWRWINAGTWELGEWILHARTLLLQESQVDLQSCPKYVQWYQHTGNARINAQQHNRVQYQIRRNNPNSSLLVLGDPRRPDLRHSFASNARGIDVVEPVDLRDIMSLATALDTLDGSELASQLLEGLSSMMTGIGKVSLMKRIQIILAGNNRTEPTPIELAVVNLVNSSSRASIANLLQTLESSPDIRVFRIGAFSALKAAISLSLSDLHKSIRHAAEVVREQRRHQGDRRIPTHAIGSTLLLKGLEADHALILDAGSMNRSNLYVALSRGAKSITVFSNNSDVP